jgi:hypothetical protein
VASVPSDADESPGPSAWLLVRRARLQSVDPARLFSWEDREDVERLAAMGGLFVLTDLAAAPCTAPLAAAALETDSVGRRAHLVFLSGDLPFAQRLLDGAWTLLRSEGIELVEASGENPYRGLLEGLGFSEALGGNLLYWL